MISVIPIILTACGGGTGGGAAPTGSSGTPVAVEIPAVNDISDIVYLTGPVVTVAGGNLSAKSATPFKVATTATYGSGSAQTACETANVMNGLLKSGALPDLEICLLKNDIASGMAAQGIDIYDGQNHDAAIWVSKSSGIELAKFRFNITRNSDDFITQFTMYVCACANAQCSVSSQSEYTKEVFNPDSNSVTITSKSVEEDYSSSMAVTGTLNSSVQYLTKSITQSDRQVSNGTTFTQSSTMVEDATTALVDGFQRASATTTQDVRIYSYLGFTYTGDPAADIDLALYNYGAGAGNLIDDILSETQCWDGNGLVASFPCAPYSTAIEGKTPMTVSDVPAVTFVPGASDYVDCSTIAPSYTAGSASNPISIETSACSGFKDLDSHMDCYDDIYGGFTVAVTINGNALSTDKNRPSRVGTTPTIVLTTNYTPYTGSFFANLNGNTGTIVLQADDPYGGSILTSTDFESSDWVSAATAQNPEAMSLSFQPTLNASHGTYTFTLGTDLSGINLDKIPAALTYYIAP